MPIDTLIHGAEVVLPHGGGVQKLDLAIEEGRVSAHLAPGDASLIKARNTIDAKGKTVLPGVIDPHTHLGFGDPKTDYSTETAAAALHGVTTLLNYLMTKDPYEEEYKINRELGDSQTHIDYGFHAIISTREQIAELEQYILEFGVSSFKFFMSFRGQEGAYVGLTPIDDGIMFELFEVLGRHPGTVPCVHAENVEVVWPLRDRLQKSGRDDLKAWHESRPPFTEAEAAVRAMLFARETGKVAYIVHTSSGQTVREARRFRSHGDEVHIETCPHYLTHTYDSPVGTLGKQNPPLRGPEDVEALWEAIADGTVDTIGSDHAPRLADKKQGSVWTASPGQPNLPVILPVLLSEGVRRRGLSLERVAEICSANVARIFGMWPRKGSLQVGADADLVIVDLDMEKTVTAAGLRGRADYSIYEGMSLTGWPVLTMLRGEVIARDGELLAKPGQGKFLHRPLEIESKEHATV